MEQEKTFVIKQSDIQKIIDYIAKHPYVEVHQLLPVLLNLKEGTEKPDDENSKES